MHGWLASRAVTFLAGVASASIVMEVAGTPLRRAARAVTREIIRGGLLASREIKRVSDSVTQEVEDIAAEVRAEMEDRREGEPEPSAAARGRARRARKV